jgi:hypothetical protein
LIAQSCAASGTVLKRWRRLPGGSALAVAHPELADPASDSAANFEALVRDWQADLLNLVRAEAYDRRTTARVLSFGVEGVAVILMLLTFSQTGATADGAGRSAGSSPVLAQRVLEAIFGDQAVRSLVAKGRRSLMTKTQELYFLEQAPLRAGVSTIQVSTGQADRIKDASALVEASR